MPDKRVISFDTYRRDAAGAAPVVDLWELVTAGATAGRRIVLRMTPLDEVVRWLGAEPDDVKLGETGVPGLRYWEHNDLVWNFDAEDRFCGVHFGGSLDDEIPLIVKRGFTMHDQFGDPIGVPPGVELQAGEKVVLRLRGRRLDQFASLPRFLGTMHDLAPTGTAVRGREKWIQLEYAGAHGSVRAGFLLKVIDSAYADQLYVDYCLHGIGFIVPHRVESRIHLPPTPSEGD